MTKKFDFVIGNPPYQAETDSKSKTNGQNPRTNIFQYFQIEADKIAAKSSVMIYPGGRWIHQFGKGVQEFGKEQINDSKLAQVEFYPDSTEIFGHAAELSDGITIVTKKTHKQDPGFNYVYTSAGKSVHIRADNPGDELMPLNPKDMIIVAKVDALIRDGKYKMLHGRILPRTLFGIESDFVEKNPDKVRPYNGEELDWTKEVKVLTNDKAGKAGRSKWFVIDRSALTDRETYLQEWQVAVSSANAGGQKRDSQIEIIDNHSCFGRSRVALASFKSEDEAINFYNYCQTPIIRFLFRMTDESLTSLGKKVLDVGDYSDSSIIDFAESIEEQLCSIIKLTDEERDYVEETIAEIDKKRGKREK